MATTPIQPVPPERFSLERFNKAWRKAEQNPGHLNDVDLGHLAAYESPERMRDIVERRDAALRPVEPEPVNASRPGTSTKKVWSAIRTLDAALAKIAGFCDSMNERNIVRNEQIATLQSQVAALTARVQELEQRPTVRYCGVFQHGETYLPASMVTSGGGLWCAERATNLKPGSTDSGWILCVKRGEAER